MFRFQDDAGTTRFGASVIDSAEDPNLLLERGELFASDFKGSGPFVLTGPRFKSGPSKRFWEF